MSRAMGNLRILWFWAGIPNDNSTQQKILALFHENTSKRKDSVRDICLVLTFGVAQPLKKSSAV